MLIKGRSKISLSVIVVLIKSILEICQSCNNSRTNNKFLKNLSQPAVVVLIKSRFKICQRHAVVELIKSCSKIYHSLAVIVVELIRAVQNSVTLLQ